MQTLKHTNVTFLHWPCTIWPVYSLWLPSATSKTGSGHLLKWLDCTIIMQTVGVWNSVCLCVKCGWLMTCTFYEKQLKKGRQNNRSHQHCRWKFTVLYVIKWCFFSYFFLCFFFLMGKLLKSYHSVTILIKKWSCFFIAILIRVGSLRWMKQILIQKLQMNSINLVK